VGKEVFHLKESGPGTRYHYRPTASYLLKSHFLTFSESPKIAPPSVDQIFKLQGCIIKKDWDLLYSNYNKIHQKSNMPD
jgi:hypothetical protein